MLHSERKNDALAQHCYSNSTDSCEGFAIVWDEPSARKMAMMSRSCVVRARVARVFRARMYVFHVESGVILQAQEKVMKFYIRARKTLATLADPRQLTVTSI
jgi:hypothetical protein